MKDFAEQPGYLTKNQLAHWQRNLQEIPSENHPYIQHGLSNLKKISKIYDEWIQ